MIYIQVEFTAYLYTFVANKNIKMCYNYFRTSFLNFGLEGRSVELELVVIDLCAGDPELARRLKIENKIFQKQD